MGSIILEIHGQSNGGYRMLTEQEVKDWIKDLKDRIKQKDYEDETEKTIFKAMVQAFEVVIEKD